MIKEAWPGTFCERHKHQFRPETSYKNSGNNKYINYIKYILHNISDIITKTIPINTSVIKVIQGKDTFSSKVIGKSVGTETRT